MTINEIREKYLRFFEERGHKIIPSSSLVPENDPTTLFTGSGMQPLILYLLGQKHPAGSRVADSQKCFRAEDIEEVGDNRHTTFFEMLGNWSFGDYFKKEQLAWFFEFLTDELGLNPNKLYVTVFAGDPVHGISRDDESVEIWKALFKKRGMEAKDVELITVENGYEKGMQGGRIFYYDASKNWWSRSGRPEFMPEGEPGGPDSEVFFEFVEIEHNLKFGKFCHPNCDCGRFIEIGNSVFMEYLKTKNSPSAGPASSPLFKRLQQKNVDFGGGLERMAAASMNNPDMFWIDAFLPIIAHLEKSCDFNYSDPDLRPSFRIIADHIRGATFMIADGVVPSNTDRGYVARRLIRRAVLHSDNLGIGEVHGLSAYVAKQYEKIYPNISEKLEFISGAIRDEEEKFRATLERGQKELLKLVSAPRKAAAVTGADLFRIYSTYGYPLELSFEIIEKQIVPELNSGIEFDKNRLKREFKSEFEKHQELSRSATVGVFKGGLADTSEKTTRLHSTHHLLLKALQAVLGNHVKQRGSNITQERLRIDFSHQAKMTQEQKAEVERIVNEKIAEDLPIIRIEMDKVEAEKLGAEHEFGAKYPDRVSVYSVGPKDATADNPQFEKSFSIEFCGGPHVAHTGQIGKFKILKEEAVATGIRRIKAAIGD